jgi:hypothetical protein
MTAACYVRSAAADSGQIAEQLRICREAAARDGYTIPDEHCYVADGVSGLDPSPAAWQRLLQSIQADDGPPFRRLYVKEPSRLSRDPDPRRIHYQEILLEDHGVSVHYAEGRRGDFVPGDFTLHLSHMATASDAGRERNALADHFRRGKQRVARQVVYPGWTAPYGFVRVLVDPGTGKVLREVLPGEVTKIRGACYQLRPATDGSIEIIRGIFADLEAGASPSTVAARLNRDGAPAPGRKGRWCPGLILQIAQNAIYAGTLVWGRRRERDPATPGSEAPVYRVDFFPDPPISRTQFDAVQARLTSRAR